MVGLAKLQLVGPLALVLAIAAAEGAAYGLSSMPSSPTLWYLNLKWFGMFQTSHYALSRYVQIAYFQLFFVAVPLLATACIGFCFQIRLLLALASNLSLLYLVFVFWSWLRVASLPQAALMIQHGAIPTGPDKCMLVVLLGLSLSSSLGSHVIYLQMSRTEVARALAQ